MFYHILLSFLFLFLLHINTITQVLASVSAAGGRGHACIKPARPQDFFFILSATVVFTYSLGVSLFFISTTGGHSYPKEGRQGRGGNTAHTHVKKTEEDDA